MSDQIKFIAALRAVFPVLSDTALTKCWSNAKGLPEAAYDVLYGGLLQGGIAAMEARRAQASAITNAIGTEMRR